MKKWHDADDVRATPKTSADDLPLFARPSVAVATSEAAAESITTGTVRAAHRVVLALLLVHARLTCEEMRDRTAWTGDFCRPRLVELEGLQLIAKCDGKGGRDLVQRPTRRGRMATCYELTNNGRAFARAAA